MDGLSRHQHVGEMCRCYPAHSLNSAHQVQVFGAFTAWGIPVLANGAGKIP